MTKSYTVRIVGVSNYQKAIIDGHVGDPVVLTPEPDNPYDPRAIAVFDDYGATLGYLPRDSWLHRALLDEGKIAEAHIAQIGDENGERKGMLGVALDVSLND